jgi:hypothetical protein
MKRDRPSGLSATAPPRRTKSVACTAPVLIAVKTAESTMSGRNSSMTSSASAGRPYRG